MSIIDKKGKLFGKLNIIDLLAVIVIVAVVALLGLKLTGGQSGGLAGEGTPVVFTVKVTGVDGEVYQSVQKELEKGPSQLVAADALQDAYVTDVQGTLVDVSTAVVVDYFDQEVSGLSYTREGTYDLVFTVEANLKDMVSCKIGTQEIRVGAKHVLKTTDIQFAQGIITSCEEVPVEEAAG